MAMGEEHLPVTDPELVHQCQAEFDSYFRAGTQQEVDGARFRLVWAMVHSSDTRHVNRGLEMAKAKLREPQLGDKDRREFTYLLAVACYKLGKFVEARKELKELLQLQPDFRQGEFLKTQVDEEILKHGLMGVGIVGAVVGVGLAILLGGGRK